MKVYCLNGVHTSGKSTVAESLSENPWPVFSEIAKDLISEGEGPFFNEGKLSDNLFQKKVMSREIERDQTLSRYDNPVVVETYHPGNIAHCRLLAERIVQEEYGRYFQQLLEQHSVHPILIEIPIDLIKDRTMLFGSYNKNIESFYKRLRDSFYEVYDQFSLEPIVVDGTKSTIEVATQIRRKIYNGKTEI